MSGLWQRERRCVWWGPWPMCGACCLLVFLCVRQKCDGFLDIQHTSTSYRHCTRFKRKSNLLPILGCFYVGSFFLHTFPSDKSLVLYSSKIRLVRHLPNQYRHHRCRTISRTTSSGGIDAEGSITRGATIRGTPNVVMAQSISLVLFIVIAALNWR